MSYSHLFRKRQSVRRKASATGRTLAFAAIATLVLAMAGYLLVTAFASRTPPAAANVIDIRADMGGFNVKELRVRVGQPVIVRLASLDNSHHTDGGGQHQWAVDEFKANVVAPPLGNSTVTFTPDQPGTYTFYCDICCGGRANPTMQGKLIVES